VGWGGEVAKEQGGVAGGEVERERVWVDCDKSEGTKWDIGQT
jgi:hypothetical protein